MATPKVFVSSTCYDLQEERAQLERFIHGYGFHPILSEFSGVYYDVDAHTHDSCVNEVSHCDLFILIISGRYGGKFKGGSGESITQAEYNKARELGLPIFTFVKADVLSAQNYYKENVRVHNDDFAKKISYPAIEKQDDAVSIFSFIDVVHRANTNNGIETYQSFSNIETHLKKQWAGMFFSFLQKRKEQDRVEAMTSILAKLADSSSKLEVLVSSLHDKEVGKDATSKLINESVKIAHGIEFYSLLLSALYDSLWEIKGVREKKDVFHKLTQKIPSTVVEGNLPEYLNGIPNIIFAPKAGPGNSTGSNVISFEKYKSAFDFSDSNWERMLDIYEKTIKSLDAQTIIHCYNEAMEKYI